jgi:hypothetical protein
LITAYDADFHNFIPVFPDTNNILRSQNSQRSVPAGSKSQTQLHPAEKRMPKPVVDEAANCLKV